MSDQRHYTIGELADAAGVTPRTIRYYTAEALLPPPDARGRYALYSSEHLLRLHLIARLKEEYLPLSAIRERLAGLEAPQLAALVAQPTSRAEVSSAADYVTQVLGKHVYVAASAAAAAAQPRQRLAEQAEPYLAAPAVDGKASNPLRYPPILPLPVGHAEPLATLAHQSGVVSVPRGASWRRITLAPGVELHIQEPATPAARRLIEALLSQAETIATQDE